MIFIQKVQENSPKLPRHYSLKNWINAWGLKASPVSQGRSFSHLEKSNLIAHAAGHSQVYLEARRGYFLLQTN